MFILLQNYINIPFTAFLCDYPGWYHPNQALQTTNVTECSKHFNDMWQLCTIRVRYKVLIHSQTAFGNQALQ